MLDQLFFRTLRQSTAMLLAGSVAILAGLILLPHLAPRLATRALQPSIFALLLGGFVASHIVQCLAIYLRSHKIEPFLIQSIAVALCVLSTAYISGRLFGIFGIALGFLVCTSGLGVSWAVAIFVSRRREFNRHEAHT